MKYAIVAQGGKQYKAVEGDVLEVDRLPEQEGSEVNIEQILLVADDGNMQIGTPVLEGIEVRAKVVRHFSGPKLTWFRYSPKKRIRVRGGHRQHYTRLLIEYVGAKGASRGRPKSDSEVEPSSSAERARKAPARRTSAKKSSPRGTASKKTTSKSRK